MKRIVKWIKFQFAKIPSYESRGDDALYGKFRVFYSDGKISQKMCYSTAKNYASMFNGEVIYIEEE